MRTAVVTGASSGIGRASAIELARRGLHVVAAGRSRSRTAPVVESILAGGGSAEFASVDLSSLAATREAARALTESGPEIEILVNNAGVGLARGVTEDGFEIHFGVNHLGHFLLTELLAPAMADDARVVTVASAAHYRAPGIDFERMLGRTRSLLGWREYGVSKLANVLFSRELAVRRPGLRTYAVHPGLVDTGIVPAWVKPFVQRRLLTPEEGADPVVRCAISPDVDGQSGLYYSRSVIASPSPAGEDDDLAAELWERCTGWIGAGPVASRHR
ncbi:MAG: SDR family NAD(P)-dependent oxidoreductase [Acidimicrobiia bacterium]